MNSSELEGRSGALPRDLFLLPGGKGDKTWPLPSCQGAGEELV